MCAQLGNALHLGRDWSVLDPREGGWSMQGDRERAVTVDNGQTNREAHNAKECMRTGQCERDGQTKQRATQCGRVYAR